MTRGTHGENHCQVCRAVTAPCGNLTDCSYIDLCLCLSIVTASLSLSGRSSAPHCSLPLTLLRGDSGVHDLSSLLSPCPSRVIWRAHAVIYLKYTYWCAFKCSALVFLCRQAVHGTWPTVPRSTEPNPRPQPGQPNLQHDQQPQRQLPGNRNVIEHQ